MANEINHTNLSDELRRLKTEYHQFSWIKRFLFKVFFWHFSTRLDTFNPENPADYQNLFFAYQNSWLHSFPRLANLFTFFMAFKSTLIYQLISHFNMDELPTLIEHPDADRLLSYSILLKEINETSEAPILTETELLTNIDLFHFLQQKHPNTSPSNSEFKIDVEQFKRLKNLPLPINKSINVTDNQITILEKLSEQHPAEEQLQTLLSDIQELRPREQAEVKLTLEHAGTAKFLHVCGQTAFAEILNTPEIIRQKMDFITRLEQWMGNDCNDEDYRRLIDDKDSQTILNTAMRRNDETLERKDIVSNVITFPDKESLIYIIKNLPKVPLSMFLNHTQFGLIRPLVLGGECKSEELETILTSAGKNALLFYLKEKGVFNPTLIPMLSTLQNAEETYRLLNSLVNKNWLYNNLLETLSALSASSRSNLVSRLMTREGVNQALIHRIFEDDGFSTFVEFILENYPEYQFDDHLHLVKEPVRLQELLSKIEEKHTVRTSDITCLIVDSQTRALTEKLCNDGQLDSLDLIQTLSHHASKEIIFRLIEQYPNIHVNSLIEITYSDLVELQQIQGIDEKDFSQLLHPENFKMFTLLNTLTNHSLDMVIVKTICQVNSPKQAEQMNAMLDYLRKKEIFNQLDIISPIFDLLIQHQNLGLTAELITRSLQHLLFSQDNTDDVLTCLTQMLKLKLKNDLLPALLESLVEKELVTLTNLFETIDVLDSFNITEGSTFLDAIDNPQLSQHLTIDNLLSVSKLWQVLHQQMLESSYKIKFTHNTHHIILLSVLEITQSHELLTNIATRNNAIDIVYAIYLLKPFLDLNEEMVRTKLLSSENLVGVLRSFDTLKLMKKDYVEHLVANDSLLHTISQLQQYCQLDRDMLESLMITFQDRNAEDNTCALLPAILVFMKGNTVVFSDNKDSTKQYIAQLITHPQLRRFFSLVSEIADTALNDATVYSCLIKKRDGEFNELENIVNIILNDQDDFGDNAVTYFHRLVSNHEKLFENNSAAFNELARTLANSRNKQDAFSKFIDNLETPTTWFAYARGALSTFFKTATQSKTDASTPSIQYNK